MAEEEKNEEQTQVETEGKTEEKSEGKSSRSGLIVWLLTAGIVLGCAVGGFALAQLLITSGPKEAKADVVEEKPTGFFEKKGGAGKEPWQFELDAVIGNLDEPGVTRYLRVAITLVLSSEMDKTKGKIFLGGPEDKTLDDTGKTGILADYLSDYISGLSLERVRGQKNRRRIKKELTEGFNELLFPDSKPYVETVLLKEFAVQ